MRIPDGPNGFPTVSPNQLRKYGVGGFILDGMEEPRGCPRQYFYRYVEKSVPNEESEVLMFGTVIHRALELMEHEPMSPRDALQQVWDTRLPVERFEEALEDLERYLERPNSPADQMVTLATEIELSALLYVDEVFGPVYIRGIIDKIGVDIDDLNVVRVVDYKSNRHPPSDEDIRRDVQGKTYTWLVLQNLATLHPAADRPRVLFHLDAIKWRQADPVLYSDHDLDMWHAWTVAIVRAILRDDDHLPVINEGCGWCPVRDTCPAYQSVPDLAAELLKVRPAAAPQVVPWTLEEHERQLQRHREEVAAWLDRADRMRLLLDKAVREVDGRFADDAARLGELVAGPFRWEPRVSWSPVQDVRRLHALLDDDQFYAVVKTTKAALERLTKGWDPEDTAPLFACLRNEPNGTAVKRVRV